MRRILRTWLPLAILATAIDGSIYIVAQQQLRLGANDPQFQMAQDAAASLAAGQSPQAAVPTGMVDMARSRAPYLIVFDDSGRALASSGQIDNRTPSVPDGVFENVRRTGLESVTWQPTREARGAAVIVRYLGAHPGFVLAGRSLRAVEERVDKIRLDVALLWIGTLAVTFLAAAVLAMTLPDG